MKIELLMTGNELMVGDITDTNSVWIGQQLGQLGQRIQRKITVADDIQLLLKQLQQQSADCDLLLVNGGLGPTQDDLTAEALALLTGQPLAEHPAAKAHLIQWCEKRDVRLNQANLKQAQLPAGANIIANPIGSAVGIRVRHNNCDILCTPGVPSELKRMMTEQILPEISTQLDPNQSQQIERLHTYGLGESTLQQWIADAIPDWPNAVELGFRAGAPTLEVKLQSAQQDRHLHDQLSQRLRRLIGDYIVAEGDGNLAANLIAQLRQRGLKVTAAESCTGGLISSMLTQQPGASSVFEAGVVTYANPIKRRLLGVSDDLLQHQGAVSEPVVQQMVRGALDLSHADLAVAVSGIAGPDGGSKDKPVGTVWIAWGDAAGIETACLLLPYGRRLFQTMVAGCALDLIRRRICGIQGIPRYLQERQGYGRGSAQELPSKTENKPL